MWTQTTTHTNDVHLNGYSIQPPSIPAPTAGRKIGRVSLVQQSPAGVPETTQRSVSISGGQGFAVVLVVALGWFVFYGNSGAGAGTGSERRLVTDQQSIAFANEAAPVGAKQLTRAMAEDYIARFSKVAVEEMRQYGVPASISLAQGLVESRAGDSKLARSNNNHFGIKCFSTRCAKGHCSNFTDDTHKDFFRKFKSSWESWRAHSVMLSSGRYAQLKKYGSDYRKWAYGLKAIGYATDATYAEKLIGVIEAYDLSRFDN